MQKTIVTLVDDISGEEADDIDTHTIVIDGAGVEIDLTSKNHDLLLEALRPFLHAAGARRVRGSVTSGGGKAKRRGAGSGNTAQIRAWAKENGYDVNDRGRVPADIREAYEKANA
ncbi:histone-like nucleoid-structuring protein Lsr2 [Streptomyces sp. NBC_01451]|uniref:histone-like nucleoid-structuring protein Lsr2 n=1 Tax=Streptomyces sp. NBC_01451 TaxID=2903872 RepID=UPI002E2F89CB|nr:Lsr2 family protein [Streptomyces sp. NBC_01451]